MSIESWSRRLCYLRKFWAIETVTFNQSAWKWTRIVFAHNGNVTLNMIQVHALTWHILNDKSSKQCKAIVKQNRDRTEQIRKKRKVHRKIRMSAIDVCVHDVTFQSLKKTNRRIFLFVLKKCFFEQCPATAKIDTFWVGKQFGAFK